MQLIQVLNQLYKSGLILSSSSVSQKVVNLAFANINICTTVTFKYCTYFDTPVSTNVTVPPDQPDNGALNEHFYPTVLSSLVRFGHNSLMVNLKPALT